jgi:hypothetical protein
MIALNRNGEMLFRDLLTRQEQQVRCGDRSGGATEFRQAYGGGRLRFPLS